MPYGGSQSVSRTPASQTALASTSYVMNGLGAIATIPCTLTPSTSGRVLVMVTGQMTADANARTCTTQLSYGTGTAPANAAAVTGTQVGGELSWVSLTAYLTVPFTVYRLVTGLVPGTTYWFDLAGKSSAGTVQYTNLNFSAIEL